MKIVIISGSPRKNANTQIMMRHVFEYTKSKNVDTKFINLSEDGFDYYHGFLPVSEILKYDLHLATRIQLETNSFKPNSLNPLIILLACLL